MIGNDKFLYFSCIEERKTTAHREHIYSYLATSFLQKKNQEII
jgi:hypothetical protein